MHTAKSYVYRNLDEDDHGNPKPGYVGRSPKGNYVLAARPGQTLTDEQVDELGLEDLEDHTDYKAVLEVADKKGAPITAKRQDGSVGLKVKGKWATGDEEAWNSGGES